MQHVWCDRIAPASILIEKSVCVPCSAHNNFRQQMPAADHTQCSASFVKHCDHVDHVTWPRNLPNQTCSNLFHGAVPTNTGQWALTYLKLFRLFDCDRWKSCTEQDGTLWYRIWTGVLLWFSTLLECLSLHCDKVLVTSTVPQINQWSQVAYSNYILLVIVSSKSECAEFPTMRFWNFQQVNEKAIDFTYITNIKRCLRLMDVEYLECYDLTI